MSATETASLRRDTVLVVDDTPDTLSLLTDTLDGAGYTVLIATDGSAALELIDFVTPDLILMDAVMPGMTGFETCRRVKREKMLVHLPVIFMTGLAEAEHVIEGLASGGVDYVTKPLVLAVLLARIRVHLGNARVAQESHSALDASGRFLFATNHAGRILWCTPKARHLLSDGAGSLNSEIVLPAATVQQMLRLQRSDDKRPECCRFKVGERPLECSFVSPLGCDELMFRLAEIGSVSADGDRASLKSTFGLTAREAEVLLWISRGKANRDIGEILNISPRTVNKHLEQVFVKLGVENRSAATAVAVRALTR